MGKDVIIACDFSSLEDTLTFLEKFGEERPFLKIGMELFYAEGPGIVEILKKRGHRIFLDLKLHDIPNTVAKAMSVLGKLGTDMCNVHTAGTSKMMKAAAEAFASSYRGTVTPALIGVTQLTSTTEDELRDELLIDSSMADTVKSYAMNAASSGLAGVVCSPLESPVVHQACGNDFLTVTPGVRLAGDSADDQHRITTPAKAKELGSDYIVVGRSITAAADPHAAYRKCVEDFVE